MWSPVSGCGIDSLAPTARTKHSATLVGGHVYLIGGRNGNLPLKDMWKYDIAEGRWYQLDPTGDKPPCLQEHTAVAYKDGIYVFGGEMGFSSATETPLWYYDIKQNMWRKVKTQKGVSVPHGRRGHTALIHRGAMLIYGGYQDLRGSSNELWSFHFETESWHLLSSKKTGKHSNDSIPPARHKHSAVLHDDAMWIYGGMTDLVERSDLWKWCTVSKVWHQYKLKHNPGPLHSHAICKLPGSMLIFGGESNGQPTNDLWKFNFAVETWEKVQIDGLKPQPRAESKAFAVSELLLKHGTVPKQQTSITSPTVTTKPVMRTRSRASTSADRTLQRHSSYIPQNRITPCEKTYVFQPTTNNYIDGSDESFHKSLVSNSNTTYKSAQPGSFLREIQKLSQLNLSKLSHNKCSYSVLNSANTESQESLLRQHVAGVVDENISVSPVRNKMVKSQSAHFANKKRLSCQISPDQIITNNIIETNLSITTSVKNSQRSCKPITTPTEDNNLKRRYGLPREPISVPNFSTLILPTPVLTPVEAAKLVYLDSEDDDDLQDPCSNLIEIKSAKDGTQFYDTFKPAMRDDSYSSHLCASIYQNIPKSASVKFQCPELEEVSDETGSTSDYASVEKVNKANEQKTEEYKKGILKTPASEGPFGFANPHYMGPDIQDFLGNNGNNRHSWNVSDTKAQQYAKLLNTPDSGVGDMSSAKSNSRHMFLIDELEMQHIDTRVNTEGKTQIDNTTKRYPPTTLTLNNDTNCHERRKGGGGDNSGSVHNKQRNGDKTRASSASRAEQRSRIEKRVMSPERPKNVIAVTQDPSVQLYVFVIGGKEQGQITVFKRPISIWRLKLY